MAAAIEPGMWVECFRAADGSPGLGLYWQMTPLPAVGALYHVEEILPGCIFADGEDALVFTNIPGRYPDGQRFAFSPRRFRPIYRPRAGAFDHLKAPPIKAPARTREDA